MSIGRNPDNPSTTFFWNDWDNEPGMKFCSLAAQGLWVKMLSMAARSREPGVVLIGDHPSLRQDLPALLSASCGESLDVIDKLITNLVTFKVASIDGRGRVINRRMVAEAKLSASRASAGRLGAAVANRERQKSGKGGGKQGSKPDGKRGGKTPSEARPANVSPSTTNGRGTENGTRQNGGNTSGKNEASSFFILSSVSKDTGAAAPFDEISVDPAQIIFNHGLAWLLKTTGKSKDASRSILGKWRQQFGSDEALIEAIGRAIRQRVQHPESWMSAVIKQRQPKPSARDAWAEALP